MFRKQAIIIIGRFSQEIGRGMSELIRRGISNIITHRETNSSLSDANGSSADTSSRTGNHPYLPD